MKYKQNERIINIEIYDAGMNYHGWEIQYLNELFVYEIYGVGMS